MRGSNHIHSQIEDELSGRRVEEQGRRNDSDIVTCKTKKSENWE